MEDRKAQFLKVYANLPLAARQEIIAVVGGEPYSWQSARIEVENDTTIGTEILEILIKLKVLR
jgi:hypothetical protein